jgi:hypothetical protein
MCLPVRYVPLKPSGVIPHPDSSGFSTGCGISNDSNRTIWSKNFADFKQVLPFRDPESSLLISPDISGFRMTTDGFLTGKRVISIKMECYITYLNDNPS